MILFYVPLLPYFCILLGTLSYSNSNYDLFCRKAQKKGKKIVQVKYLKTSKENIIQDRKTPASRYSFTF